MSYYTRPQVIYKRHYHFQNFSPLANGLCLIVITNKTPLLPHYRPNYQDGSSTYRGARFESLNHKLDEDYIDLEAGLFGGMKFRILPPNLSTIWENNFCQITYKGYSKNNFFWNIFLEIYKTSYDLLTCIRIYTLLKYRGGAFTNPFTNQPGGHDQ